MTHFGRPHRRGSFPTAALVRWPVQLVLALGLLLACGFLLSDPSLGSQDSKSRSKSSKSKPSAKTDEADEPGGDDESTADDDLTALVVPSALGKIKSPDRLKFAQELRGLLMEGSEPADGPAAAKRHFEAARRISADDPRAAYGYGVILLSQANPKGALEQFRAAAKLCKAPYLPALQGIAWVELQRNDYARGLPALLDLAGKIEDSSEPWPTGHDKRHTAEWLGRMMGFLAGPGKTVPTAVDHAAQIEAIDSQIAGLLSGERLDAFEHGRRGAARRHVELKALAARPAAEVLSEARQKRDEIQAAIKVADGEIKELEEALREIKRPHDKQIADLSHEMREESAKTKKLSRELADAQEQVEELAVPRQYPQKKSVSRYRVPTVTLRNENAQERKARETQLASAKEKLAQIEATVRQSKERITEARKQRDAAQLEFRKASADKRQALQDARRKSSELAARAKDAQHAMLSPEKLKALVTALEAYVPLDPATEKDRLLATLKSPAP
ncbi:MAG TPA: hypothetical protein VKU82_01550 [Planctomycetaceae bacterium]|nr:hypothetical protein [Planctomycetaceae bacterium]